MRFQGLKGGESPQGREVFDQLSKAIRSRRRVEPPKSARTQLGGALQQFPEEMLGIYDGLDP